MNTTIDLNIPEDKLSVIVRYDKNTNRIYKITFACDHIPQLVIEHTHNIVPINPNWENFVSLTHVNAAREMIMCFNNQSQDVHPNKLYYDLLLNNAILRKVIRDMTPPPYIPECHPQYMYDYVPYQDIIKADIASIPTDTLNRNSRVYPADVVLDQENLKKLFTCEPLPMKPIDHVIEMHHAPENQTCYMNVLKGRPEHSRFNMTYDRDMMEHITPEAIQTLFDHINKE